MLDVRNAISNILDRFTLADIVEITLRKMRKNKVPLPFVLEPLLNPTGNNRKNRGGRKKAAQSATATPDS
jgi:hypothetical protein